MLYANISCHYWFCCWLVSANEKSFLYFKDNIFLLLKLLSLLLTYRWGMKLEWTRVLRFFCQASLSGFSLELCWAHPLPTATKLILLLQILFFLMVHRDLSFLLNPEFLQGRDEGSICLFHVPYIILDRTEGFERSAAAAAAKSLQSCLTLSNPMDCSLQAPLSMGFSRQEYWSGVPLPSPFECSTQCLLGVPFMLFEM